MKPGLSRATVRVFEPSELAPVERERLLAALELFVNLGNSPQDFETFRKQNPEFFRDRVLDILAQSPIAPPMIKSAAATQFSDSSLALLYRDELRKAWDRGVSQPQKLGSGVVANIAFMGLLGLGPVGGTDAWLEGMKRVWPSIPEAERDRFLNESFGARFAQLWADWKTGMFEYQPFNDFQRAVYILFREGWRAKKCARCSRYLVADKPLQRYCSINCSIESRRERNLALWKKYGKKWRARSKPSSRRKGKSARKGGKQR